MTKTVHLLFVMCILGDNDTGKRGFPGAKSTPNFMMQRENSVPKFEHSYTHATDLHHNSSSTDLLENQFQKKVIIQKYETF